MRQGRAGEGTEGHSYSVRPQQPRMRILPVSRSAIGRFAEGPSLVRAGVPAPSQQRMGTPSRLGISSNNPFVLHVLVLMELAERYGGYCD